ncbi:MAG: glycosyltransferase [Candidatus Portnoybacteria bacterium]|nr:glycosyltransferase [Candidatus Portnoybacteria bacterium]
MKIALVHDYLIRFGGAERVFLNLQKIFPQAEIYTLLYNQKKMGRYFPNTKIHTSFLQKFPFSQRYHRILAPLIPAAVESLDLRDFDLVVSSSSAFIKGLVLRPKVIHICYCHNPARFLWDYASEYNGGPSFLRKILLHYLRLWDRAAANRVDYFIANSKTTAQRIKKYYDREARVIYPAIGTVPEIQSLRTVSQGQSLSSEYFLIVSQLTPYKRIDLAIDAFNKLELPLVIIGQGRHRKRLQKMARSNIKFLGWQPDEVVRQYLQNCLAFIFPGEDDFGIAPVEAMSFGKPVLAYRQGGATETILEGITGEFFDDPVTEALADGIRRLKMNLNNYSPLVIKKRAEKFSQERFEREIKEFVIEVVEQSKKES